METNKKTFEFTGVISGYAGCFVWLVDYKTFVQVTGREPEEHERTEHDDIIILYPEELFGYAENVKQKVKIEVWKNGHDLNRMSDNILEKNLNAFKRLSDG